MFSRAEHRPIRIVVELNEMRTPEEADRISRAEAESDHRPQALRPRRRGADRCHRPVKRARALAHLPTADEPIPRARSWVGTRRLLMERRPFGGERRSITSRSFRRRWPPPSPALPARRASGHGTRLLGSRAFTLGRDTAHRAPPPHSARSVSALTSQMLSRASRGSLPVTRRAR